MKKYLIFISIFTALLACDKVKCPNEDGCVEPVQPCINNQGVDTCQLSCLNLGGVDTCLLPGTLEEHHSDSAAYRKILIEEYTGYKCTNCPDGARKIDELLTRYGDTLVAVSIHAGTFAEPGETGGHTYETDFRTDVGDEYNSTFLEPGSPYPSAVIDRTKFNDIYVQRKEDWQTLINQQIASSSSAPPVLQLTSYYAPQNGNVLGRAKVIFQENSTTNYGIVFLMLENGVVDVQLDGGNFISDYEHKHVLRAAMSKYFGETVNSAPVSAGDTIIVDSDYLKLDAGWNVRNCEVVAILVDFATLKVEQVQHVHISE